MPGSLVASALSSTEISLSWNASTDNVGVTGYRVYRSTNGSTYSLAGTSTTTGFADLGLTAGTTYWYRVTAVDAAGNESSPASASTTHARAAAASPSPAPTAARAGPAAPPAPSPGRPRTSPT